MLFNVCFYHIHCVNINTLKINAENIKLKNKTKIEQSTEKIIRVYVVDFQFNWFSFFYFCFWACSMINCFLGNVEDYSNCCLVSGQGATLERTGLRIKIHKCDQNVLKFLIFRIVLKTVKSRCSKMGIQRYFQCH